MPNELSDLRVSFQRHLRAEGLSPRTLVMYEMSVRFFGNWLVENGQAATAAEVTRDNVRNWLSSLVESNYKTNTVIARHKAIRRFVGWLVAEGEIKTDVMAKLAPPRPVVTPVPLLSDGDLAALIKACQGRAWIDRRDEAMFRLLLDAGIRVGELVGLALDDVRIDEGMAVVTGKGNKIRAVYFGAKTTRALDRWERARRLHQYRDAEGYFLGQRGTLSDDGVRRALVVRAEKAGIGHVFPHQFRHTFAHDFLLNGGGERDLKRLAGWSSDVMLERYGSSAADLRAREAAKRLKRGDRV